MEAETIHNIELTEQHIVMIIADAGALLEELGRFYYSRRKLYYNMYSVLSSKSKDFLCKTQPKLIGEIHE